TPKIRSLRALETCGRSPFVRRYSAAQKLKSKRSARMLNQIGRLEAHVEHIQLHVTDLCQDVKTVLRQIGESNENGRDVPPAEKEGDALKVALHDFPDLGLIVKAATNVIYTNQTGGFACWHPEVEGFLVPLGTH